MSALDQIREGLGQAWQNVAEGWRHIWERAGQALTRFHPRDTVSDSRESAVQVAQHAARWGLLPAEVEETGDNVVVRLEVPGLEHEDLDLRVVDRELLVRGERRVSDEREVGRYHVMERAYGSFERTIPLPVAVNESEAKAKYKRGVLTVTLPKRHTERSRKINVSAG